jgi:hypothetical protein
MTEDVVVGFPVPIAPAHVSLQLMHLCGSPSSLMKRSHILYAFGYIYVIVVDYLMRFIYMDMWPHLIILNLFVQREFVRSVLWRGKGVVACIAV